MNRSKLPLATLVILAGLSGGYGYAQESAWEMHTEDGLEALREGKYSEAEHLFSLAVTEAEKLGPSDARLTDSLNHLAEVYKQEGKYAESELAIKRAITIKEHTLGPDDPSVATSLNVLGAIYFQQRKYGEAGPCLERALGILEKTAGANDPKVTKTQINLAELYRLQAESLRVQGKNADAEPLYKRAITIYEKNLGANHPDTATCLRGYAALLRKTNRNEEAAKLEARAKAASPPGK